MRFFKAHACGDRFVGYAEGSAEPATIVRAIYRNDHDTLHLGKQACRLVKGRLHDLGGTCDAETAKGAAAVVDGDRVLEFGPRKRVDFQNVVEEFHQLIGVLANMLHVFRLFEAIKMTADLFYAASGRPNDAIKFFKVFDEKMFGRLGILFIATIGHRLPATGLVERVTDIKSESLQKLQRGDSNLRIDKVDVAGYEQTYSHVLGERPLKYRFGLRDHLRFPFPISGTCKEFCYEFDSRPDPVSRRLKTRKSRYRDGKSSTPPAPHASNKSQSTLAGAALLKMVRSGRNRYGY